MTLGERIREKRKAKGLTIRDMGEVLNLSYSIVAKYERNEVPITTIMLEKLAKILGTSTEYLLKGHQSKNLLDNFNAISEYIDNYPYHLLYFPRDYKLELYNKLKELDTENWLPKDFSIYSSAEEFWTAINYFDLEIDESKLIQIKPEDKDYYIDFTIYNDIQLLELDTITKMVLSLFERQNNFTEENKKALKKFISDFYKKTM